MCDPILFGTAAVAASEGVAATAATTGLFGTAGAFAMAPTLMTAGTVLSATGSLSQGDSAKEAANAQAQETLNQGAYKADAAKAQAEKIRKAGKTTQGEANTSLAASGVKLGEGTALEVQKTIATNSEEDALSALLSGKRASDSADQEAKLLVKAGDNAVTGSYLGAASTVLAGAGKAAYGWKSSAQGR